MAKQLDIFGGGVRRAASDEQIAPLGISHWAAPSSGESEYLASRGLSPSLRSKYCQQPSAHAGVGHDQHCWRQLKMACPMRHHAEANRAARRQVT